MIIPLRLMADECAAGYWGRVVRVNGLMDAYPGAATSIATNVARAQGGTRPSSCRDLAPVIGALADLSSNEVLLSHTMLPFDGAVPCLPNGNWFDRRQAHNKLRQTAVRRSAWRCSLCPQCVTEDLRCRGFSYWRRSHQIEGVVWCPKHGCPLHQAGNAVEMLRLPHDVLTTAVPFPNPLVELAMKSTVVLRYAEICSRLLGSSRPTSRFHVLRSLAARARANGIGCAGEKGDRMLSDLAAAHVPPSWVATLGAHRPKKRGSDEQGDIDDVLSHLQVPVSTADCTLAVALLFDDADAAIEDLQRPLPNIQSLLPLISKAAVDHVGSLSRPGSADISLLKERLRRQVENTFAGTFISASMQGGDQVYFERLDRLIQRCLAAPVVATNTVDSRCT